MRKLLTEFGDRLDRLNVGGWAMLLAGLLVIGVTVFAPIYLEVEGLRQQKEVLRAQKEQLGGELDNYEGFVQALREGDPLLLQRLAWNQFHLKPVGAETLVPGITNPLSGRDVPIEQWLETGKLPDPTTEAVELPQSRLIRLTTGPQRPWMLVLGGWLVMSGLLISARPKGEGAGTA